jgi:hypothetical protein
LQQNFIKNGGKYGKDLMEYRYLLNAVHGPVLIAAATAPAAAGEVRHVPPLNKKNEELKNNKSYNGYMDNFGYSLG